MVKNLFFCISLIISITFIKAQTSVSVDSRIYSMFPSEKVEWMIENETDAIYKLNVLLQSYEILDLSLFQGRDISSLRVIEVADVNTINILSLNISPISGTEQLFYLSNQQKILRIFSLEESYLNHRSKNNN